MSDTGLEKSFKLIGTFTDEVFSKTIEMMKIHPLIALLNHNLMAHVPYALTAPAITEGEFKGQFEYAPGIDLDAILTGPRRFATRQGMVADIFRENANKSGTLLGAETAGKLFSNFSVDKILEMLT